MTVVLAGACAGLPEPDAVDAAASGPGAALAQLLVDNQTTLELAIGYRRVTPPRTEIIVGRIGPETQGGTAPIPAGEPIVLVARNPAGAEYSIPIRSFPEGAHWTWVIAADAPFLMGETSDPERGGRAGGPAPSANSGSGSPR